MFALLFRTNPGSAPPRSRFSLRHHSGRPVIPFAHLVITTSLEQPTNVEKSYTCARQDANEKEGSHAKTQRRKGRKKEFFGSGDCPARPNHEIRFLSARGAIRQPNFAIPSPI